MGGEAFDKIIENQEISVTKLWEIILKRITEILQDSMCSSRKYPYSPHRRDWNFLGDGGSIRPNILKKCMKHNWNFQMGGGS